MGLLANVTLFLSFRNGPSIFNVYIQLSYHQPLDEANKRKNMEPKELLRKKDWNLYLNYLIFEI